MHSTEFEQQLATIIERKLEGKLLSCKRLSGGASQETYCLEVELADFRKTKLALRRAPVELAETEHPERPGIRGEISLIRAAYSAGVPVPHIVLAFEIEDRLGEGFIMQWLEGETLGARIVRAENLTDIRPKLAYQCGQALARIHTIDVHTSQLDTFLQSVSPEESVNAMCETYRELESPQPMIDYTARWLQNNLPEHSGTALVHSDFRNGNLMINAEGICAVLDWELAHLGDPMRDLGWICTNSWRFGKTELAVGGFGERADLFQGYEDECGIRPDAAHVKFWEVFGSFWWAIACLGMARQNRSALEKSVERPGIARRTSECQIDCVNLLIPGPVTIEEPNAVPANSELPRVDELVASVSEFLRESVMQETDGRTNFMARVAANSLDIVQRDLNIGVLARAAEKKRLSHLLDLDANLDELRWTLVDSIRNEKLELDNTELIAHLRTTVANQVAIDQPRYSGLKTALINKAKNKHNET